MSQWSIRYIKGQQQQQQQLVKFMVVVVVIFLWSHVNEHDVCLKFGPTSIVWVSGPDKHCLVSISALTREQMKADNLLLKLVPV